MSSSLIDEIMRAIGFGESFHSLNGAGSCGAIRREAAEKLEGEIARRHDAGVEIAAPDVALISAVKDVAQHGDRQEDVLTDTWRSASAAIHAHVEAYRSNKPQQVFRGCEQAIRSTCLEP